MTNNNQALERANKMLQERNPGAKLLALFVRGSRSFGLNTPKSDEDYTGVYLAPIQQVLGGKVKDMVSDAKSDFVMFELAKFTNLVCGGSTDLLGSLFVRDEFVLYIDPMFEQVFRKGNQRFITKVIGESFGGNAISEINRAGRISKNVEAKRDEVTRKTVLEYCYMVYERSRSMPLVEYLNSIGLDQSQCALVKVPNAKDLYAIYGDNEGTYRKGIADDDSNDVRYHTIPLKKEKTTFLGYMSFNKDAYAQHCKKYQQYMEWYEKHNKNRYISIDNTTVDSKALMHAVRIARLAEQVVETGTLDVYNTPEQREYYLSIREGKHDPVVLFEEVVELVKEVRQKFAQSEIPSRIGEEEESEIVLSLRQHYYML